MKMSAFIVLLFVNTYGTAQPPKKVPTSSHYANRLWYTKPAINWNEALPLGNGRLGAMVYGSVRRHLSLNEQTLWSGGPRNWNNPDAKKYLPLVRQAIIEKKYRTADSLCKFMQGPYTESYMPMADLVISYEHIRDSNEYTRALNIDSALSIVQFSDREKKYTRTAFSSFPSQVIIYHDSCSVKGSVSFKAALSSKLHYSIEVIAPNHIVLRGKCPKHVEPAYYWRIKDEQAIQYDDKEGMRFEVHLMVKTNSGKISIRGYTIQVDDADAATLMISAATSYNGYDHSPGLKNGKDPSIMALKNIQDASLKSFGRLKQRHVGDYQPILDACSSTSVKALTKTYQPMSD